MRPAKIISGIQQVGVGVPDVEVAWAWFRKYFGMDVPVFQEAADAPLMAPYTGGEVQSRTATLALNMNGGGGMEIWQFTSRTTEPPALEPQLGDHGLFTTRLKCRDVAAAYDALVKDRLDVLGSLSTDPAGRPQFFVRDPYGMLFQVVAGDIWFSRTRHVMGGPVGCMIGVSDIPAALPLYRDLLEYDTVVYDVEGSFDDLAPLPGGSRKVRRMLLGHSVDRKGPFSRLFGPSHLELVQSLDEPRQHLFRDRFWGDLGFIHLCFDIKGMDALKAECEARGFPFTVDSQDSFDMGEAAGRFSYIEDPDGTLIEFVETHKIPILKKLGWYLNIEKRPSEAALPDWMLKLLALGRVK